MKRAGLLAVLLLTTALAGCAGVQTAPYSDKSVMVLGQAGSRTDGLLRERAVSAALDATVMKMSQAGFVVLDEGPLPGNFRRRYSKQVCFSIARQGGADWLLLVSVDANRKRGSYNNPGAAVGVGIRMELLEVDTRRILANRYRRGEAYLDTPRPSIYDWEDAAAQAGSETAEILVRQIVASLDEGAY